LGLSYLVGRFAPNGKKIQSGWPGWGWITPWIVVSGCAGYLIGRTIADVLTNTHRDAGILEDPHPLFLIMSVIFALSVAGTYYIYVRGRIAGMEADNNALMRSAAETQLKMLQSQLEPHMLFNTLANLRILIGLDPPRAQAMLDRVISFLRSTLEASRTPTHPLSAEFSRIGDYLEMMQVRMGPRLTYRLDLPADLASRLIPPMLLQPIVENSIKHGLEPKVAGGEIIVMARRVGESILLSVRDTGIGLSDAASKGTNFGLHQVRERIDTLYGSRASLELAPAGDAEGGTLVNIAIPITQLPSHLPGTTA
jgi:LytS/YehU family sensor histidine kinase